MEKGADDSRDGGHNRGHLGDCDSALHHRGSVLLPTAGTGQRREPLMTAGAQEEAQGEESGFEEGAKQTALWGLTDLCGLTTAAWLT